MLILGSNECMIKDSKKMRTNKFNIKDLGVTNIMLGIKITRTSDGSH
jgi:hypothetical protein